MKFYFSNMHDYLIFEKITDILQTNYSDQIVFYLDTNICINLRDLYDIPSEFKQRNNGTVFKETLFFLREIKKNNIKLNYQFGIEEACRSKQNFQLNVNKLIEMKTSIDNILSMDYLEILEHSLLIRQNNQIKDNTVIQNSKFESLNQDSSFKDLVTVMYTALLKLYLLNMNHNKEKFELMIDYLNFLDKELNLVSPSYALLGHYYLSETSNMKKIIHPRKKEFKEIIHAIWNTSIDLSLTVLIPSKIQNDKGIPIFVTADERLYKIFDCIKIRAIFNSGNNSILPPMVEVDLSKIEWNDQEFKLISQEEDKIMNNRIKRVHQLLQKNKQSIAQNALNLVVKLEDEIKMSLGN
ncbi:hypothetical protein [Alkalihalobacillus sp. AL-G]|uniref:hypothetical protein n=1 Tax=Alkalihalobacillus sp. AL-G TaxID=2926399 RepID=UPI00272AB5CB|nr:hypothetical protein [Alkalihalobacillus sp. AL-G]WLD93802.1 hypothetical protein MOJ78_02480 [Alkalihalobacillus sp. AL-G]